LITGPAIVAAASPDARRRMAAGLVGAQLITFASMAP